MLLMIDYFMYIWIRSNEEQGININMDMNMISRIFICNDFSLVYLEYK